jgi:hypothetical protein
MTAERLIKIPPLESGDRLPRDEFERRYRAMPNLKKAELIEGVVYVASPLRAEAHSKPHGDIFECASLTFRTNAIGGWFVGCLCRRV